MRHIGCAGAGICAAYGHTGRSAGLRCDHAPAVSGADPAGGDRAVLRVGSTADGYPGAGGNRSGAGNGYRNADWRRNPADGYGYASAAGVSISDSVSGIGAIAYTAAVRVGARAHAHGGRRAAPGYAVSGRRYAHAAG